MIPITKAVLCCLTLVAAATIALLGLQLFSDFRREQAIKRAYVAIEERNLQAAWFWFREISPEHATPESRLLEARLAFLQQRPEEAVRLFAQLVRDDPANGSAFTGWVKVALASRNPRGLIAYWETEGHEAARLLEGSAYTNRLSLVSAVYAAAGDQATALGLAQVAHQTAPDNDVHFLNWVTLHTLSETEILALDGDAMARIKKIADGESQTACRALALLLTLEPAAKTRIAVADKLARHPAATTSHLSEAVSTLINHPASAIHGENSLPTLDHIYAEAPIDRQAIILSTLVARQQEKRALALWAHTDDNLRPAILMRAAPALFRATGGHDISLLREASETLPDSSIFAMIAKSRLRSLTQGIDPASHVDAMSRELAAHSVAVEHLEAGYRLSRDLGWQTEAEALLGTVLNHIQSEKTFWIEAFRYARARQDTARMLSLMQGAIRSFPNDPVIRNNYVYLSALLGESDDRVVGAAQSLEQDFPNDLAIQSTVAFLHARLDRYDEAIALMASPPVINPRTDPRGYVLAYLATRNAYEPSASLEPFFEDPGLRANLLPEERALLQKMPDSTYPLKKGPSASTGPISES